MRRRRRSRPGRPRRKARLQMSGCAGRRHRRARRAHRRGRIHPAIRGKLPGRDALTPQAGSSRPASSIPTTCRLPAPPPSRLRTNRGRATKDPSAAGASTGPSATRVEPPRPIDPIGSRPRQDHARVGTRRRSKSGTDSPGRTSQTLRAIRAAPTQRLESSHLPRRPRGPLT